MSSPESVEFRPCYAWTCDGCGIENFVFPTPANRRNMEDALGVPLTPEQFSALKLSGVSDAVIVPPGRVTCRCCGAEYHAKPLV